MVEVHEGFEYRHAVGLSGGFDTIHLLDSQDQWFLAQHMLAILRGRQAPFTVEVVGQGDVNGVDLGVGQEILVAPVCFRDVVSIGVVTCSIQIPTCHGNELAPWRGL